jgi:hypothetical protein
MQELNPEYIVGLVDGEGSFTVYVKDIDASQKVQRRVAVEPRFYIKLIEEDRDILYSLKQFFDCGSVYFQKDTRLQHKNCYRYEVYNRDDLIRKIIPFFQKYPLRLSSKRDDFETFCVLMQMIQKKEHLTQQGLRKMFAIKQAMH